MCFSIFSLSQMLESGNKILHPMENKVIGFIHLTDIKKPYQNT